MYIALLGRFISRDPVGYVGGPNLRQFADASPIGSLDPTGLATLHFHPQPYWKLDWYLAPLPADPKTGRQIEGLLFVGTAYIQCKCDYCKAGKSDIAMCGAKPKCKVVIKLKHVLIHTGVPEDMRSWVYGHEQRHAGNIERIGMAVRDALTAEERKSRCGTPAACERKRLELQEWYGRQLELQLDRERRHDPDDHHPFDGQYYESIGPFPPKKGDIGDPGVIFPEAEGESGAK